MMTAKIVIVDYGTGNLHSVRKSLHRMDIRSIVSARPADIKGADKIILPGVGHFARAMSNLRETGLADALNEAVLTRKKPVLGICVGMQLMAGKSDEGDSTGLGWFDAEVLRFQVADRLKYKIPHIGWNRITRSKNSSLMKGISETAEFYFVHSYHVRTKEKSDVLNETNYETTFTSALERDNIFGVQYHPEKSYEPGALLLRNFLEL